MTSHRYHHDSANNSADQGAGQTSLRMRNLSSRHSVSCACVKRWSRSCDNLCAQRTVETARWRRALLMLLKAMEGKKKSWLGSVISKMHLYGRHYNSLALRNNIEGRTQVRDWTVMPGQLQGEYIGIQSTQACII